MIKTNFSLRKLAQDVMVLVLNNVSVLGGQMVISQAAIPVTRLVKLSARVAVVEGRQYPLCRR